MIKKVKKNMVLVDKNVLEWNRSMARKHLKSLTPRAIATKPKGFKKDLKLLKKFLGKSGLLGKIL